MSSSKGIWSRLASLNGLVFVFSVLGFLWFLTTVAPSGRLAYLGVLGMSGVVVLLTGFLLFFQPQD